MSWVQTCLNGKQMLVRMVVKLEELSYTLSLTDSVNVWEEKVEGEKFKTRWQRLNSDLEGMEASEGLIEVRDALQNKLDPAKGDVGVKTTFISSFSDDEEVITLKLSWRSDGLPLHWEATLVRGDVHLVHQSLTKPLVNCIANLLQQRKSLANIIHAKDLELEDLRSSGAQVSLPQLQTKWFNIDNFLVGDRQQGTTQNNTMNFLCSKEMSTELDIQLREDSVSKQEETAKKEDLLDSVDGSEPKKKRLKASPLSSPMKLTSKVPVVRPDLSKLAGNSKNEKRAKLGRL